MAKFPQNEWIEVNERLVPLTKPQHYKKGSTTEVELTGHDNPLPTADYGMTASGLWIPKRVSDDGAVHTQLTGSIVEEIFIETEIEISAGGSIRPLGSDFDVSKYKDIIIHFMTSDRSSTTIRGLSTLTPFSTSYIGEDFIYEEFENSIRGNTGWVDVEGTKIRVDIINMADKDIDYSLYIYGRIA